MPWCQSRSCVRGHRATTCKHAEMRALVLIRRPGRPVSSRQHRGTLPKRIWPECIRNQRGASTLSMTKKFSSPEPHRQNAASSPKHRLVVYRYPGTPGGGLCSPLEQTGPVEVDAKTRGPCSPPIVNLVGRDGHLGATAQLRAEQWPKRPEPGANYAHASVPWSTLEPGLEPGSPDSAEARKVGSDAPEKRILV